MKPTIPGRLHALGLVTPRFDTAIEVVRHLGFVQSQLPDMALWSVARRTPDLTLSDLQAAFDRGDFLRTHTMRGTWHFVDPTDVHWMLSLTAPRVTRQMASINASIGLTPERLDTGAALVAEVLADGGPRPRSELAEALGAAGLDLRGQALGHVLMHAEIHALIANGPMQGKQHTYALLPPATIDQSRDELLAQAARRYARGHGPVRDKDLAWWTGLTLTDSRRAITGAELRPLDVDGQTYWQLDEPVEAEVPHAMLLPNFDEYISYVREPEDYDRFAGKPEYILRGGGLLMLDGRLSGAWTRTISAKTVTIVIEHAPRLSKATKRAIEAEAAAFGRFVDRDPRVEIIT